MYIWRRSSTGRERKWHVDGVVAVVEDEGGDVVIAISEGWMSQWSMMVISVVALD